MKFLFSLITFSFLLLIVSCTENENPKTLDEGSVLWEEMTKMPFNEFRQNYIELTPNEKHLIWSKKMELVRNHESWNITQREFIRDANSMISVEFFSKTISEKEESSFMKTAFNLFEEKEVYRLFFVPHGLDVDDSFFFSARIPVGDFCSCRYSISCGFGGLCESNGCDAPEGCGIFGNANCTGECDNNPID